MNKKKLIIFIILAVLVIGGVAGYLYYKSYQQKHQPNIDIATQKVSVPAPTKIVEDLAEGKEPQYTNESADATGLYPTLSGVYEPIWDGYKAIPLDIVAFGKEGIDAYYKVIWSKKYLYIQVKVFDETPDTTAPTYDQQDCVEFFINEDGNKNSTLVVGDSHYIVNRDNGRSTGFGADSSFESITYEFEEEVKVEGYFDPITFQDHKDSTELKKGYYVEVVIPLLTIKASKNNSIGFDVQVSDAIDGKLSSMNRWASNYLYTFQNFSAVGTLTFK